MPYASNDSGAKTSMAEYAVSCTQEAEKALLQTFCANGKCIIL